MSLLKSRRVALLCQLLALIILVIAVSKLVFSSKKQSKPVIFEPIVEACSGAVEKPIARSEDYVQEFTASLAEEAKVLDRGEQALDVAFYGDSIAETWRGTDMGRDCQRCNGGPEIFKKYFGRYKAHIFAVGGDQAAHLQWRLLNGELMLHLPPKVAVLMIGTNDLGAAVPCFGTNLTLAVKAVNSLYSRIENICKFLQAYTPTTRIVLVGLPQRAIYSQSKRGWEFPNQFTAPIEALNHILRKVGTDSDHIHYVACGDALLRDGKIDLGLQADGLHLTPEGSAVMAACILSTLQGILGPGSVKQASMLTGPKLSSWYATAKDTKNFLG